MSLCTRLYTRLSRTQLALVLLFLTFERVNPTGFLFDELSK